MSRNGSTKADGWMFLQRGGWVLVIFMGFFLLTPVVLAVRQTQYAGQIGDREQMGRDILDRVPAKRGCFLDRNGHVLAGTGVRYEIFANPARMADQGADIEEAVNLLTGIAGGEPARLHELYNSEKTRVVLNPCATQEQRDKLLWLKRNYDTSDLLKEIGIERMYCRTYPVPGIPGGIFGWVRLEKGLPTGAEGLERGLEFQLKGHDGMRVGGRGLDGRPIGFTYREVEKPIDGNDVVLTIDGEIQQICYSAVSHWVQKTGAKRGVVMVIGANSGDFLGIAQYPCIDPGEYGDCADNKIAYSDFVFHSLYEPGSVGKPLMAAVAVSDGLISPEETFYVDNYRIILDGYPIREYHRIWDAPGRRSLREIIVQSSNIGISVVGNHLGEAVVRSAFERFGFTTIPDVFLQGIPDANLPSDERKLCSVEIANMFFGQGYAISPAQLGLAYNIFASGGRYHPGTIVKGIKDSLTGELRPCAANPSNEGWQAITAESCTRMVDILHDVTIEGTGRKAACEGFLLGGKTGTAQVASPDGGYYQDEDNYYIVSFAGFGPLPDPGYTIVVVIERPRGESDYDSGGKAAAPCFKEIFEGLMYLESRRSAEEGSLQAV